MNNKPRQCLYRRLFVISFLLISLPFFARGAVLKDMKAVTQPDGVVELKLLFDGSPPIAKGYSIEQPPRLSIDLSDTSSALNKYNELGFDAAESVTVVQSGNRTRLVVKQKSPTGFTSRRSGNALYIAIGGDPATKSGGGPAKSMPYKYEPKLAAAYGVSPTLSSPYQDNEITLIDFKRGKEGEGNVILTLSNGNIPMDINEVSGRIRLQFKGDILPDKLRNRLDVIDFGTPVHYIDAKVESGETIINIEPKGNYDYLAYQTDNKLTISVKTALSANSAKKRNALSYKGEKMSLNFQNIEVRAVLQLIADFTDLNLVASDTVTGSVTLRLKNVPWDHALDIVLQAKGLDKRLEGNILTVAPAEEIAAREKQQLENEKQIRELSPVYTDLVQINYADAAELAAVLSGENGESLLTEQGSVQVVERTNSLLIKDTQTKLDEIRELLSMMDIPVRQVLIEARIVTLSSSFSKQLGVKWSGGVNNTSNNKLIIAGGGNSGFQFKEGETVVNNEGFIVDNIETTFRGNNVFTDLGVAGDTAARLGIGFVTNGTLLNLELSALLSDGGGEVISQPKVVTADKQTALIKAGKQIPYTEASSSGATTVSFHDALLSLEVTPQITPEGRVIMDIKVTNDDTTGSAPNGVPIIDKNEITTQVLVEDGETVVLGGVFKQTKKKEVHKVPLLGDIPYIGALFRKKASSDDKSELMVFITPRVIQDDLALR
ncbi:MAG: type IV pilus secretin PilQ family protein [Endozoicomonas sp. (ex Botrylloides leachii)]|nr:type IV pilus secretin PilQ family protein [Endozoicomonas sp. (ex Botrylloides leachii)]